jgi:hypothetical protein
MRRTRGLLVTPLKASPATLKGIAGRKFAVALGSSELCRQVAIDLKADADFDEHRSGPGHDCFLSVCHEVEVSSSAGEAKALLPVGAPLSMTRSFTLLGNFPGGLSTRHSPCSVPATS